MSYTTRITIWSDVGVTPITGRKGNFCDTLVDVTIQCDNPGHAKEEARRIKEQTPYAAMCHYSMPDYPNQNVNVGWFR